nr:unnamed protein product [Spirometra erinaceieuropaei]
MLFQGLRETIPPTVETTAAGSVANLHARSLFLWDRIAGVKFLVGSGAEVLRGLDFVYAYIDDLLVASSDAAEPEVHHRQLSGRLDSFCAVINAAGCDFGVPSLIFWVMK